MNKLIDYINRHSSAILLFMSLVAWLLGAYGYAPLFSGSWSDALYASLKHFTLDVAFPAERQMNAYIDWSRWLAAATLAGTIINLFSMLAKHSYDNFRLKYFYKDHYIVCGVGQKGARLAEDILNNGHKVVVIEINADSPALQNLRKKGIIVIIGDATDATVLEVAMLDHAEYMIATTGIDQTNILIAHSAMKIKEVSRTQRMLQSIVQITDESLRQLLYQHPITNFHAYFDLRLFSFFECGAHEIIREQFSYNSVGGPQHLVLIGFGKIGKSVLIEVARWGDIFNGAKLSVSVFSKSADKHEKNTLHKYPHLSDMLDIHFYPTDVDSLHDIHLAYSSLKDKTAVNLVVVSLGEELQNFKVAHELANIYERGKLPKIVICGNEELGRLVDDKSKIFSYSMLDKVCSYQIVVNPDIERMAKSMHEYYLEKDHKTPTSKPWKTLSQIEKDWNRDPARHIQVKLKLVGCSISNQGDGEPTSLTEDEITFLARVEHARWLAQRLLEGWSYGESRNDGNKIHPSLKSFDKLSCVEVEKDIDSVRAIPVVLQKIGLQITRIKNISVD